MLFRRQYSTRPISLPKPKKIKLTRAAGKRMTGKTPTCKIKVLRRSKNIETGKRMTPEEIAAILGMHPADVKRILENLK